MALDDGAARRKIAVAVGTWRVAGRGIQFSEYRTASTKLACLDQTFRWEQGTTGVGARFTLSSLTRLFSDRLFGDGMHHRAGVSAVSIPKYMLPNCEASKLPSKHTKTASTRKRHQAHSL